MFRLVAAFIVVVASAWAQSADLLILHKGASSLGFYTLEGAHLASLATGTHPHEMVRSADGRLVYATDNGTMLIEQVSAGGNSVSVIDIAARKRVAEISTGQYRRPHGIDLDPKTGLVYVSCELPDQLLAIDPAQRKVVRTYDTKGKTAHMVKLSADGNWAFVSHSNSANVGAVQLATGAVKLIPTGNRPEGSALSPDGKLLYVVNREAAQITVIDPATQTASGLIKTGKGPVRVKVAPGGAVVYALMHDNAIGIADAKARKEVATVKLGGSPVSLELSPDGALAYASAQDLDTVYVVSVKDRKIVREIKTSPKMFPDAVMALR
ncbi:MAG: beta-propeller fold lactonase family protein [Bryobacteraceae bacterium]|nr:beta-propeller fold lactonase family protein [Bryobacteraceae bacterium]